MMFRGQLAFYRLRYVFAVLVVLFAHVFPTIAQVTGFDVFTAPNTPGSTIAAGSTFTIKWTPSPPAGLISIVLLEDPSNDILQLGPTVARA